MNILDVRTFTGSNEEDLYEWLGDKYLMSHDYCDGSEHVITTMTVWTVHGSKEISSGTILVKDAEGNILTPTEKWCDENLVKVSNEDMT